MNLEPKLRRHVAALLLLATLPAPTFVRAESPTTFEFEGGKSCWRFEGVAGRFSGELQKGQKVVVTATGDKAHTKGDHTWMTTEERDVEIAAPDPDMDLDLASDGGLTVPATGRYVFSIDPISDAATPGVFVICKR